MSNDRSWKIYKPDFKQFRKPDEMNAKSQNSVRVYRSSPDRVELQIRGENKYFSASLPFEIARQVAAHLLHETGVEAMGTVRLERAPGIHERMGGVQMTDAEFKQAQEDNDPTPTNQT